MDLQSVAAIVSGDERAWAALYASNYGRVRSAAWHVLHDADDADEIAQETFLRAWRSRANFEGRTTVASYLYGIAVNAAIDRLRIRRRGGISLPSEDEINGSPTADRYVSVQKDLDGWLAAQAALAKIGDFDRIMLSAKFADGLSYEEISEMTGVPLGTVKSRFFRMRKNVVEAIR